ncbi:phosphatase PAP2 family protein [bacterium]|nr:phosphatase PAP2 family protein [bacterium]
MTICILIGLTLTGHARDNGKMHLLLDAVRQDYGQFYGQGQGSGFVLGFGSGALMAHTGLDPDFRTWYQQHARCTDTDALAKNVKLFGEGKFMIPLSCAAAAAELIRIPADSVRMIKWGLCTARSYFLGAPAVLVMQRMTGASRPGERRNASYWRPMKDDNGVSGHAFVGAVPFLTLARLNANHNKIRYLLYGLSMMTAWSRINDDKHYFSQAMLGWFLAWEATGSVFRRGAQEKGERAEKWDIGPGTTADGIGIQAHFSW